ncbi:chromate transporter [Microvirga guangxiensis]|uniref:Chromate transporter n=1 Tax=Microvirga guangxiensis TaxID=549386 RepID=A0A1G5AT60_9HYPH|nr:chromate transporter [Microvirga guangxiensis]SCX81063.1 chromate transporter [Microvirga guangxiensis]
MTQTPGPVPLLSLFFVFFRVGLFSFGGGLAGWVHREVVAQRGWMSDDDFFSGLALSQILPGANVTNLSVYIGQRLRGPAGAACALVGLVIGPFFAVIALATAYAQLATMPWIQNALTGAAAAAIGLLLVVAVKGARNASRRLVPFLILVATFVAVGLLQWPLVPVVLALAPLSVAFAWWKASSNA